MVIKQFKDEYRFLSNFYPSPLRYKGNNYPTVEHAYQAAKTDDPLMKKKIGLALSPGKAKKLGNSVILIENWDQIKIPTMEILIHLKFKNDVLREKLLSTKNHKLEEGNFWHDNFWGNCFCPRCKVINGKNMLGKILMNERKEIFKELSNRQRR